MCVLICLVGYDKYFALISLLQKYFNHTRSGWGVGTIPDGKEYYQACLTWYLSLNRSPQDVHELGLREVARVEKQMQKVGLTD